MKLVDQVDLLIFLETTLLLYFLIEFDSLQNPKFDANDWWTEGSMCNESEQPPQDILNRFPGPAGHDVIAFGEDDEVDAWKTAICATDEDLKSRAFTFMMGCFAVALTLSTCQLYVVKGMLVDEEKGFSDFDVRNVPWPLYFKTFFGPYLITFGISAWLALIVLWLPCCYDAGTFCIGFCFTVSLVLTYILPYVDEPFMRGLKRMNESERRDQREMMRDDMCLWGLKKLIDQEVGNSERKAELEEMHNKMTADSKGEDALEKEQRLAVLEESDKYYLEKQRTRISGASYKQLQKIKRKETDTEDDAVLKGSAGLLQLLSPRGGMDADARAKWRAKRTRSSSSLTNIKSK